MAGRQIAERHGGGTRAGDTRETRQKAADQGNGEVGAGKLLITYLPEAVPAGQVGTSELGPLPSPLDAPADQRGRFWAVDRFGGAVAFLEDSGDVTVKLPHHERTAVAGV